MSPKNIFLLLSIAGTLVPYYFFFQFITGADAGAQAFLSSITDSPVASFFAWDVIISVLVVWGLIMTEGQRLKMKNLWVYLIFSLLVGVSLALPAFLYQRELALEKIMQKSRSQKLPG